MKIVHDHAPRDEKEIAAEQRQVKQTTHIASVHIHPGHRVWQFDLSTGEITEAEFEKIVAKTNDVKPRPGYYHSPVPAIEIHKRINYKTNCLYVRALNKKNALKKFIPMYEELVASGKIIRTHNP